ncbi:hypothetical protein [Burkholderia vietnamiensis]|uniref:hypothetical protein n=1 Tax=Burkholderia vietnamiensis TaxID=60552 RepID=UPI00075EFB93|nr:hypothetical protein [Burkholderia vietnamiensis]KVR89575.1 hypothetical protein WK26_27635 [Burkholderia vietnamiensis]KVS00452.1 hypothetical protein WK29_01675 [Burkholderia vietnamiensis]KVS38914.1 hypothetical protein WK35_28495 [Burkholderia vietnamiensis]MBR8161331.1 hypothetical protein [Burkholderia vietnamiensis]MBR8214698.1 hypothetical protein [Burkholderia vietnamiensis]
MAKFLIDGQALDDLAAKIQRLEVLFDVIQEEVTGANIRLCVLCDIGSDIATLVSNETENLRRTSRVEVSA